jgi:hypothetical protein
MGVVPVLYPPAPPPPVNAPPPPPTTTYSHVSEKEAGVWNVPVEVKV